jgi:hypothetical protein
MHVVSDRVQKELVTLPLIQWKNRRHIVDDCRKIRLFWKKYVHLERVSFHACRFVALSAHQNHWVRTVPLSWGICLLDHDSLKREEPLRHGLYHE